MEARFATECDAWRAGLDPEVEERLVQAIDEVARFPVLDGTVMRILSLCDDPEATTAEIVAAIEHDASFAVNLLGYANSAALARQRSPECSFFVGGYSSSSSWMSARE